MEPARTRRRGAACWPSPGSGRARPSACTHLEAITALRHCPQDRYRGDILGLLSLLLGQLGRAAAPAAARWRPRHGPAHPAVRRAMRLLEADLARPLDADRAGRGAPPGPGYLVRLFKDATGLPPMAYLARLRAEHGRGAAAALRPAGHRDRPRRRLAGPELLLARRFKAHYGLSATTYRARFAAHAAQLEPKLNLWPGELVSDDNLTHSR